MPIYTPEIQHLNLGDIYGKVSQIQSARLANRLNAMQLAEAEKKIAKETRRDELASMYTTPAQPGRMTAGQPGGEDVFSAYKRSSAPPLLDNVQTTGDTTFINQGPTRTGTPTGFGYQPERPASFNMGGYLNQGTAEGLIDPMEADKYTQANEDKLYESKMTFYAPVMKTLIEKGDGEGLKKLMSSMKQDPVLAKKLPPELDLNLTPSGELETTIRVTPQTVDPRTKQPFLDPVTKQPIEEGVYKFVSKNGQLVKVEPVSPYGAQGVSEAALAIRAARGDKEAQTALDYLAKKRATNEQQIDFRNESAMRKEFLSLPEVKEYPTIDQQSKRALKALSDTSGNKVAVDQSIITTFNKMLDPASVVRESEYARTPQDMALLNRIRGKWEKIASGGAGLTDDERQAMYRMITAFKEVADTQYNEQVDYYSGLANRYGYSTENVVRLGGRKADSEAPSQAQPKIPSASMKSMPDPQQHKGRIVKDTGTGARYQSDGTTWRTLK